MKLIKKKIVKPDASPKSLVASWASTDPSKFKALAKQSIDDSKRAPEFWVRDGERRRIRFLDKEPIATFNTYQTKLNGKPARFVQPPDGEPDLFAAQLDLRPIRVFLYRIIDIDGYTDKQGQKKTNLPRFYVVGPRIFRQIDMVIETGGIALNKADMIVCRAGSGTNTTYTFMQRPPSPESPAVTRARQNFPKWLEFYRPLPLNEQRRIVSLLGADTGEDSED